MLSAKLLTRLAGTAVATMSAVTIAAAGGAFAAAPASAATHHAATRHAATTHSPRTRPEGAPAGCNSNNFCSYNQGNGGSLCFQTSVSVQAWRTACANHNDGAYDRNGNSVELYYYAYYDGAYAILYSGNYWLYMTQNKFTNCSNNCDGLGEAMANNVASNYFN